VTEHIDDEAVEAVAKEVHDHFLLTTGMRVAMGSTCRCRHWNRSEREREKHIVAEAISAYHDYLKSKGAEILMPGEVPSWFESGRLSTDIYEDIFIDGVKTTEAYRNTQQGEQ
jgi:hypothetical protein